MDKLIVKLLNEAAQVILTHTKGGGYWDVTKVGDSGEEVVPDYHRGLSVGDDVFVGDDLLAKICQFKIVHVQNGIGYFIDDASGYRPEFVAAAVGVCSLTLEEEMAQWAEHWQDGLQSTINTCEESLRDALTGKAQLEQCGYKLKSEPEA